MTTKIDDIFSAFLSSIDDYNYVAQDEEDETLILNQLFRFYKYARANFTVCKKDLGTNYNSFDTVPSSEVTINDDLDYVEEDIIVSLMKVRWVETKINSEKVLQQAMTDKDFSLTSQANHLRQLTELLRVYKGMSEKAMTKYTYRELGRT